MTKVLTVKEAADFLRCHPSTIYRLVKRGQLPAFKVGIDWRFRMDQLEKLMRDTAIVVKYERRPAASL